MVCLDSVIPLVSWADAATGCLRAEYLDISKKAISEGFERVRKGQNETRKRSFVALNLVKQKLKMPPEHLRLSEVFLVHEYFQDHFLMHQIRFV